MMSQTLDTKVSPYLLYTSSNHRLGASSEALIEIVVI